MLNKLLTHAYAGIPYIPLINDLVIALNPAFDTGRNTSSQMIISNTITVNIQQNLAQIKLAAINIWTGKLRHLLR